MQEELDAADVAVQEQGEALELIRQARAIVVTDDDTDLQASEFLSHVASARKRFEAARLELVKPLKDHARMIDDRFKRATAPLREADSLVREKVIVYRRRREAAYEEARLAEQRAADAERLAREADFAGAEGIAVQATALAEQQRAVVDVAPVTARVEGGAATTRGRWVAEVVDEGLVPREFLKPDTVKINAAVRGGARDIPGVRIELRSELAVRS